MLYDDIADPEATSPAELQADYVAQLADVIEARGVDAVADETGVARETLDALAAGDADAAEDVTLEDAAAVAALHDETPDADAVVAEVRDNLLLGMTTAVLDVDTIAADMDDMDGKQVHQKVEGRAPMTLAEYARLHHFIASRQR